MPDAKPATTGRTGTELPSSPPQLEAPTSAPAGLPLAGDPFGKPLAAALPTSEEGGDEENLEEDDELPGAASAPSSTAPQAAKKVAGRGGAAGPRMRKNQIGRLSKLTGGKVEPTAWAQALKEEARRACEAVGEPFEASAASASSSGPGSAEQGAGEPDASASDGPSGHKFTPARPEEIFGQPAHDVAEMASITGLFWGLLAKRCEGTAWDFSGEREITILQGTPHEKRIVLNPPQKLTDLSAVLAVKHGAKVTGKATSPEVLFGGALLFAFGPQLAGKAFEGIQRARTWWKNRKGGE
jgi:hypothetical protein